MVWVLIAQLFLVGILYIAIAVADLVEWSDGNYVSWEKCDQIPVIIPADELFIEGQHVASTYSERQPQHFPDFDFADYT